MRLLTNSRLKHESGESANYPGCERQRERWDVRVLRVVGRLDAELGFGELAALLDDPVAAPEEAEERVTA